MNQGVVLRKIVHDFEWMLTQIVSNPPNCSATMNEWEQVLKIRLDHLENQ